MSPLEKELLKSLKKGNEKSFELVFKTYYSKLCTFAFDYTKQLETAEDLVKDFFVLFWNNREKLEITTSLSGYMFRSVRNSCINYLEREKKKNTSLSYDDLSNINLKIQQPISQDYPIENIFAKELETYIHFHIDKLPDNCREIFNLSRFEGLSHKKIAEQLNISENTVKVQIYRALKKLRSAISTKTILLFHFFSKK